METPKKLFNNFPTLKILANGDRDLLLLISEPVSKSINGRTRLCDELYIHFAIFIVLI